VFRGRRTGSTAGRRPGVSIDGCVRCRCDLHVKGDGLHHRLAVGYWARPGTHQHIARKEGRTTRRLTLSRLRYTQRPTAQTAMTVIDSTLFQPKIHPTEINAIAPARTMSHLPGPTAFCTSVHSGWTTCRAWIQMVCLAAARLSSVVDVDAGNRPVVGDKLLSEV